MRIVPPIRSVRGGTILSTSLINHIIERTEYGAELLARYKMVAGTNMFVEQAENGLAVSYLTALAGGAGTGRGGAGTGSGGAGTGTGGAGTGSGGGGTRTTKEGGNLFFIGISASTGGLTAIHTVDTFVVNNRPADITQVLGTATYLSGTSYRLTANQQFQVGAIYASTAISSTSFSASFNYQIGGSSNADGFALIFSPIFFLGQAGGGLGYQGGPLNSAAVEIDIFQNPFDPNNSHIAVLQGGNVSTHLAFAGVTVRPGATLAVSYSNKTLTIFHNGLQIISHPIDLTSILEGN